VGMDGTFPLMYMIMFYRGARPELIYLAHGWLRTNYEQRNLPSQYEGIGRSWGHTSCDPVSDSIDPAHSCSRARNRAISDARVTNWWNTGVW
jgi:hypothetical protein